MSKGFTIKCNECGLKTTYTQQGNMKVKDNDDITMHSWGYTHETRSGIYCECGNEIGHIEEKETIHPFAKAWNDRKG